MFYFLRHNKHMLEEGIEKAKKMLTCIFKQVQAALDMNQVVSCGPFLYLILHEVSLFMMLLILIVTRVAN